MPMAYLAIAFAGGSLIWFVFDPTTFWERVFTVVAQFLIFFGLLTVCYLVDRMSKLFPVKCRRCGREWRTDAPDFGKGCPNCDRKAQKST